MSTSQKPKPKIIGLRSFGFRAWGLENPNPIPENKLPNLEALIERPK